MGQAGEAGWTIGRGSIAIAMGEPDKGKGPVNLIPGERVAQGRATLDKQAEQDYEALLEGRSFKMQSQIVPKTK